VDVAQLSLWYGVDDLDGTVQEEKIYHMAGARTPEVMTTDAIQRLIRAAGREPVERDTLYNMVGTGLFSTDPASQVPGVPASRLDPTNNSARSVENSPVPLLH
jgi:hypothetical protein